MVAGRGVGGRGSCVALLMEVPSGGIYLHCVKKKGLRRGYHKRFNNAKGSRVVIISGSYKKSGSINGISALKETQEHEDVGLTGCPWQTPPPNRSQPCYEGHPAPLSLFLKARI